MFCDVEVQDSPTIMTQDYQHEQDPEGRRRDREEIQGNQLPWHGSEEAFAKPGTAAPDA
jgi:hypothetical protein